MRLRLAQKEGCRVEIEGDLEPAILGDLRTRRSVGEIMRCGRCERKGQSGEQSEQGPPDSADNPHGRTARISASQTEY